MGQNISQVTATGSYSDSSTQDVTNTVTWTVSDSSIATVGSANGQVTIQPAGQIWGATIGVTATLAPGAPGTASLLIIASDSGSVAPRMPQQNDHWQALGLSPWGTWWGLQEGAGNAVGSGSNPLTLGATGVIYGYPIPAWIRKSIRIEQTTTEHLSLTNDYGSPPNWNSTGSMAFLVYGKFATPSATTIVVGTGNANTGAGSPTTVLLELLSTGKAQVYCSGTTTAAAVRIDDGRVHPVLLVYDVTNSRVKYYSDLEKLTGSFNTLYRANSVTASMGLGNASTTALNSASGSYTFFAFCTGSVAESISDDGVASSFLKSLGWSPTW